LRAGGGVFGRVDVEHLAIGLHLDLEVGVPGVVSTAEGVHEARAELRTATRYFPAGRQ